MSNHGALRSPASYTLNCSTLLTELPLLERPAAAATAGFDKVEFWWPFGKNPEPSVLEIDVFISALDQAGVTLTGLNFWAGDMSAGDRGVISNPQRRAEFARNVEVVVAIGERTGCRTFNALYGLREPSLTAEEQHKSAIESLCTAAEAVASLDASVLVEPISATPGYLLPRAADAMGVLARARTMGISNLALLADFYHLAVNGEDVSAIIEEHAPDFGHIQIADYPGRGAPGTGELPLLTWVQRSVELGYRGPIGLEYKQDAMTAFAWLNQ